MQKKWLKENIFAKMFQNYILKSKEYKMKFFSNKMKPYYVNISSINIRHFLHISEKENYIKTFLLQF